MLINISLVVITLLGALVAFGGDTWRKTDERLFNRITPRGWCALFLWISAAWLGVVREMRANANAESTRHELAAERAQHRLEIVQLNADLKEARTVQGRTDQRVASTKEVVDRLEGIQGDTKTQVQTANDTLRDTREITKRLTKVQESSADTLAATADAVSAISNVQQQVRALALLTALSQSQEGLDVRVTIPLNATSVPRNADLVDVVFPRWQTYADQDPEQTLFAIGLSSSSHLNASLIAFRKNPGRLNPMGLATTSPTGTETRFNVSGSAFVTSRDGKPALTARMRLGPSQGRGQVPIDWIEEFRKGTEIAEISVSLRPDLEPGREAAIVKEITSILGSTATMQVPVADREFFKVTYGLKFSRVNISRTVPRFIEATYVIDSGPTFDLRLPE